MALPKITQEINTIKSTYLPKSGGTITGKLYFTGSHIINNKAGGEIRIVCDSEGTTVGRPALILFEKGNTSYPGYFYLRSANSSTSCDLVGKPDGTLTWGGNNVITSKGGYTVNGNLNIKGSNYAGLQTSNTSVTWGVGSAWNNAPCISLYSPAYTDLPGVFAIRAISSDGTRKELVGYPNGNLHWAGKHVVRIDAQSTGATGYRRYADGFRIQWGRINVNECVKTTVTLPIAFSNANYHVDGCNASGKTSGNAEGVMTVSGYTTTSFKISTGYIDPNTSAAVWFACGY